MVCYPLSSGLLLLVFELLRAEISLTARKAF